MLAATPSGVVFDWQDILKKVKINVKKDWHKAVALIFGKSFLIRINNYSIYKYVDFYMHFSFSKGY